MPHKARSFTTLPGPDGAQALLAEIATAKCSFAPVAAEGPLGLYGAGDLGHLARDFLKAVGRDFDFVVDRNARKLAQTPDWGAVTLLHPDDVPEMAKNDVRLAVSVVTAPYVAIEQSLLQHGFKEVVPFYDIAESFRQQHPLSNGWFAAPLSPEDQENTAHVLTGWADDASRGYHLQFLAWRRLREEWIFEHAPISNADRFFIPEVTGVLNSDEILLDGGAHHGNVVDMFTRQTNGTYRQIIAIEPDPPNRARLREREAAKDIRVTIHDYALAESEGQAQFHGGLGYASQISQTGRMSVATHPLDALSVAPTFIKLHLEGAELDALKGARETLLSRRPIVAATVYHNADGIWRTALWLMETLPRYRFLFRAHSWCGTGAVIYAIPNERYDA